MTGRDFDRFPHIAGTGRTWPSGVRHSPPLRLACAGQSRGSATGLGGVDPHMLLAPIGTGERSRQRTTRRGPRSRHQLAYSSVSPCMIGPTETISANELPNRLDVGGSDWATLRASLASLWPVDEAATFTKLLNAIDEAASVAGCTRNHAALSRSSPRRCWSAMIQATSSRYRVAKSK